MFFVEGDKLLCEAFRSYADNECIVARHMIKVLLITLSSSLHAAKFAYVSVMPYG